MLDEILGMPCRYCSMMSIFGSLKGSWYLGKGSRAFKDGHYDKALRYFLFSLECAEKAGCSGELAVRKEAIAETYLKLGNYDKAKLFAFESIEIYRKLYSKDQGDIFKVAINRMIRLLDEITSGEGQKK